MKRYAAVFAVVALSMAAVSVGWAQSGGVGAMDMKNMDMMGKDKNGEGSEKASHARLHKGAGTVTDIDTANDKVTIAHGPDPNMVRDVNDVWGQGQDAARKALERKESEI